VRLAARRPGPEPDPGQLSLFPSLPSCPRIQPALRLTEAIVARLVPPRRPGVYYLKKVVSGGRVSERVGRDDVDLRQRLLEHARAGDTNVLFGWVLAESAGEAYELECYLWHAQGGSWGGIDGDAHPSQREPIPFLRCPDCEV
jgi:hypothetical protein